MSAFLQQDISQSIERVLILAADNCPPNTTVQEYAKMVGQSLGKAVNEAFESAAKSLTHDIVKKLTNIDAAARMVSVLDDELKDAAVQISAMEPRPLRAKVPHTPSNFAGRIGKIIPRDHVGG